MASIIPPAAPSLYSDRDLSEIVDETERTMAQLTRWRSRLLTCGAPLAATYYEGAWDALSFGIEAAFQSAEKSNAQGSCGQAWIGRQQVKLRRLDTTDFAILAAPLVVPPPPRPGRAIGSDLAGSLDISSKLCGDDVAAALMASALSHADWLHVESDEVFRGDGMAAHALVSTLVGRTSFPLWTRWQLGGLIDRSSADALASVGWRRLSGVALPSA